jgi:hypothetical protein
LTLIKQGLIELVPGTTRYTAAYRLPTGQLELHTDIEPPEPEAETA